MPTTKYAASSTRQLQQVTTQMLLKAQHLLALAKALQQPLNRLRDLNAQLLTLERLIQKPAKPSMPRKLPLSDPLASCK